MEIIKIQYEKVGQTIIMEETGNIINDVAKVHNFLYNECYSVPDISINNGVKIPTNLRWIRENINTNLKDIKNIRYINDTTLEIKYINGDIIKLFAD